MSEVLTVNSLSKRYNGFEALKDVNMHIPQGAIYGFIGRNGAGKTTLIRLICGLQEPTSGEYSLYGIGYKDKNILSVRRRMGAVVETPSIYLNMTATDNLKEQYRVLGLPSYEGIPELLKIVGLENTGKKKARHFSLGMKQRLGIAVALVGKPDFLVLDEPINGLDPQGIVEIRELLLKLNREHQITILISSHILEELGKLATHYGFIHHGRIIKELSTEELNAICRKYIHVEVSDTKILAHVLDEMKIEYRIHSNTEADIYEKMSITPLALALSKENCELISVQEREESLESYYISLVGGDNNA